MIITKADINEGSAMLTQVASQPQITKYKDRRMHWFKDLTQMEPINPIVIPPPKSQRALVSSAGSLPFAS